MWMFDHLIGRPVRIANFTWFNQFVLTTRSNLILCIHSFISMHHSLFHLLFHLCMARRFETLGLRRCCTKLLLLQSKLASCCCHCSELNFDRMANEWTSFKFLLALYTLCQLVSHQHWRLNRYLLTFGPAESWRLLSLFVVVENLKLVAVALVFLWLSLFLAGARAWCACLMCTIFACIFWTGAKLCDFRHPQRLLPLLPDSLGFCAVCVCVNLECFASNHIHQPNLVKLVQLLVISKCDFSFAPISSHRTTSLGNVNGWYADSAVSCYFDDWSKVKDCHRHELVDSWSIRWTCCCVALLIFDVCRSSTTATSTIDRSNNQRQQRRQCLHCVTQNKHRKREVQEKASS